jgi:acyl dehydratase
VGDVVEVGSTLPQRQFRITRAHLVRYAGASGDFNPIHYSDRIARAAGLPGVIAHGMYTMALGARVLADWAGSPAAVVSYGVRFTKPVVVPDDDDGVELSIGGLVTDVLEDGLVRVELIATCDGEKVLGQARATVRIAASP